MEWGLRIEKKPAREATIEALRFIENGAVDVIMYLTMPMLAQAKEQEETRRYLASVDLLICAETLLAETFCEENQDAVKEVEEDTFFTDFIKRIVRAKQHIFLVADSEDALESYEDYLHEIHENAEIAGKYLWDEQSGSEEDLINEINGMTPHVVISALSFEKHMQLLCCNKAMLNADLWIARPDGSPGYTAPRGLARLAQKFLYKQIMREEP